jgi:calcium binding protein 39
VTVPLCSNITQAKKDASQIFNNLLRRQIGTRLPTVEYICKREAILFTLVNGYVCSALVAVCS